MDQYFGDFHNRIRTTATTIITTGAIIIIIAQKLCKFC